MELRSPSNGETIEHNSNPKNGGDFHTLSDEIESNCSTPYVSAPSSPGRSGPSGYFFSAPASPVHYILSSTASIAIASTSPELLHPSGGSFEFGGASSTDPMISADEIFLNGQIRPMKLSSHLQRPQALAPLEDLEEEEEDGEIGGKRREVRLRSRSIHRRARSMSPMRSRYQWEEEEEELAVVTKRKEQQADPDLDPKREDPITPTDSASSSRRNSKRWIFIKDLLYRSKSEGRERDNGKEKEKFWHSISFSPAKEKPSKNPPKKSGNPNPSPNPNPNGITKRRVPARSAHERLYTANRAQAEEMRRRTFLPYRQGLLGCLGFSSRGFGAVNGFAKTLNPVSVSSSYSGRSTSRRKQYGRN